MKEDFLTIKKIYGEHIAKLCREIVPELFEDENLVPQLLSACFAPHNELYQDMLSLGKFNVRNYMYSKLDRKEERFETDKNTKVLLKEVGYSLFVCTKPDDINYFKSCYDEDELLCTYRDGVENRFKDSYYFFLVKDNAFSLNRSDFKNPRRDDAYSTSLICLQIDRINHNVKMVSRYNHSVDYADSMFSNNLDNVVPGLRCAMERDFNIKISQRDHMDLGELYNLNYIEYGPNKTMFKYNEKIHEKYYCPNNVVLEDNEVHKLQKDYVTLIDYYVVDNQNKELFTYDPNIEDFYHRKKFKKCDYFGGKELDTYKFVFEDDQELYLLTDKMNRIVSVTDNDSTEVGDHFFGTCHYIVDANMRNVHKVGDDFIGGSTALTRLFMPCVEEIGDDFASYSRDLKDIHMDYLKTVGNNFFMSNVGVTELYLPNLISMGDFAFMQNTDMKKVYLPKTKYMGSECFGWCTNVHELYIPNLERVDGECFVSDYNSYDYINDTIMNNFDRGDSDDEMDMGKVQSSRR